MNDYIVFENVRKDFSGNVVLKDVSFSIKKGEIHALLGENGAGKSTLLNIFNGLFSATSGEVKINGEKIDFKSAHDAIDYGIAKVHQEIICVPELSVYENIMLGDEKTVGFALSKKEMIQETQKLLDMIGCNFSPQDKMSSLSAGQKQMVAIAKALQINAKIISFDEPTASLSDNEAAMLFSIIENLKNQGITILYISHKMDEIFKICDRATILRDGEYIATFEMKDVREEDLIHAMVGRDVGLFAKRMLPAVFTEETVLSVKNLSGTGFQDVSFDLKKGEILGFFGLVGAGRSEVMRALFGIDPSKAESINLYGQPFKNDSPQNVIKEGVALISENRKEEGFVPNLNNMDNIILPNVQEYVQGIFINKKREITKATEVGAMVGLKPNDPNFMTASLSGGNIQKVILAKWLSTNCSVFIFDEPTKGIDIGAKADIYKLMEDIVAKGQSIIMVSSELTEIIGMCDRVIIMHEGDIKGELQHNEFNEESILAYAMGGI